MFIKLIQELFYEKWDWTAINAIAFIILTYMLFRVAKRQYVFQNKAFEIDLKEKRYAVLLPLKRGMRELNDEKTFLYFFYNIPEFVENPNSLSKRLNESLTQIQDNFDKAEIWFDKDATEKIQNFIKRYRNVLDYVNSLINENAHKSQNQAMLNNIRSIMYDSNIPEWKDKVIKMVKIDSNLLENIDKRINELNKLIEDYTEIENMIKKL